MRLEFLLGEIFVLYKDVVKYAKLLLLFALWAATFTISIRLFGDDVSLKIPYMKNVETVSEFNMGDFSTPSEITHYSDLPLKISIYDPELFGINCMNPCDTMASGQLVEDYWGKAAACASEFPFGTKIWIEGVGVVECQDRGGAIVSNDEFIWIDLLLHESDFHTVPNFGSLVYNWGVVE